MIIMKTITVLLIFQLCGNAHAIGSDSSIITEATLSPCLQQPVQKNPPTYKFSYKSSSKGVDEKYPQNINVYCCSENEKSKTSSDNSSTPNQNGISYLILIQNVLEAFAKLLGSIAWPFAAIFIAHYFRKELAFLLARLKRGKVGSAEFEFAEYLSEAEDNPAITLTTAGEEISANTAELASKDPRSAVIAAWLEVELALKAFAKRRQIHIKEPSKGILPLIREVQKAELLNQNYIDLLHDLRTMRNEAAHAIDFSPPTETVIRYVQLTKALMLALREPNNI